MKEKSATQVVTGKVRFSYAHVHEPHAVEEGQDKKYSVSILIPKSDKLTLSKIEAAVMAATAAGKSAKFAGKIPPNLKLPLRDGDAERPDNEEYEGMFFINASSKNKPGIVDQDRNEIMSKEQFYSGCWGRASVNFYAFNVSGNKGIACGLNNLQFMEDGENLGGGGTSAAEDFGEPEGDSLY